MAITMYGIRNCDTVKKARAWLESRGIDYRFHDYKAAGVDRSRLERWSAVVGWEALLNRAGTTYRKLPEGEKRDLDQKRALDLMMAQPSIIKRPVLETDGALLVGFRPESYAGSLGA